MLGTQNFSLHPYFGMTLGVLVSSVFFFAAGSSPFFLPIDTRCTLSDGKYNITIISLSPAARPGGGGSPAL